MRDRLTRTPHTGTRERATVSYLHGAAQRVPVEQRLSRLQQALAQVDDLKRALALSQQESAEARKQVEFLNEANAQYFGPAVDAKVPAARYSAWHLLDLSMYAELDRDEMSRIEQILSKRRRFRKREVLFRTGDRFSALYAIHSGSCKTVLLGKDGQHQVAGFHMAGEIVGIDGIGADIHDYQATALEDLETSRIPFDTIENLARLSEPFRQNLNKLLAQESARVHALMLVLGTMRAEQRLAAFLLDLSEQYRARGYSPCEFMLRMTRGEIGSYLGLKLETVCRLVARFQREGTLQVQGRVMKLLDPGALGRLVDCGA